MSDKFQFLGKLDFLFKDKEVSSPNYWVAGGALLSCLVGTKTSDYDIFSNDPERVKEFFISRGALISFDNEWVCNLKMPNDNRVIQIVKKYIYEGMAQTIGDFDFTFVSAAYDGINFICHERFFVDAAQKRMVINNLIKPLNTVKRMMKYSYRGYSCCPVALSTVLRAVNEIDVDWNNPDQNVIDFYPDGSLSFMGID